MNAFDIKFIEGANAWLFANPYHDSKGRFASKSGVKAAPVNLQPTDDRAYTGQVVPTKRKMTKQQAGALGEQIAIEHLKKSGVRNAKTYNVNRNNEAVDVVGGKNAYEVKAGLVSNSKGAQQWRATIGEPGKAEKAWLKTQPKSVRKEWKERRHAEILQRKRDAVKKISQERGEKVRAITLTTIINHDKRIVDVFEFEGFHLRIGWNHPNSKAAHVASYRY